MRTIKSKRSRKNRHPHTAKNFWKARSRTIQYILCLLVGVLLGSIYAAASGTESLLCQILVNQLQMIPERGIFVLLRESLLFAGIMVFYLLVAGRCLWGSILIPIAPLMFGIGQGSSICCLLQLLGNYCIPYVICCVLLPQLLQIAALILLCNTAKVQCQSLRSDENAAHNGIWLFSVGLLILGCLLEQLLKSKLIVWIL